MTLQDLINQTLYAAKKVALGAALGFSLAGALGVTYAYGQTSAPSSLAGALGVTYAYEQTSAPSSLAPPPVTPVINSTNPVLMIHPILKVALGLLATRTPRGAYGIPQTNASRQQLLNAQSSPDFFDNGLDTTGESYPDTWLYDDSNPTNRSGENTHLLKPFISGFSPERQRQFYDRLISGQKPVIIFEDSRVAVAGISEMLSFPSLHQLQESYRQVKHNVPQGSIVYKAEFRPGYYVHYPQARRIYYVERGDVVGKRRTTIVHSITDEDGTVLFHANKQGEMIRVQSSVKKKPPAKTVQHPLEKKIAETDAEQPTAADIGIFQNIFDCQAKLELYSVTGVGVGSLAVIGPLAALYIRHRRRRSRHK